MKRYIAAGLVWLVWGGFSAAGAAEIRSGEWEFSIEYRLAGVPQEFPGYTHTQCITPRDPIPRISRPGHECNAALQGVFGRSANWLLNCSTTWEMVQGMGRIHYWDNEAEGNIHLQIMGPQNPPQNMHYNIEGRYLGPCKEPGNSMKTTR